MGSSFVSHGAFACSRGGDFERSSAAPPPQRQEIVTAARRQHIGEAEETAEQGGAVVVREVNQASHLHQTAQFDQVMCPLASLHDPGPLVMTRGDRFSPPLHCEGLGQRSLGRP